MGYSINADRLFSLRDDDVKMLDGDTRLKKLLDVINYPEYQGNFYLEDGSSGYKSKLTLLCSIPILVMMMIICYLMIKPLITQESTYHSMEFDMSQSNLGIDLPIYQ